MPDGQNSLVWYHICFKKSVSKQQLATSSDLQVGQKRQYSSIQHSDIAVCLTHLQQWGAQPIAPLRFELCSPLNSSKLAVNQYTFINLHGTIFPSDQLKVQPYGIQDVCYTYSNLKFVTWSGISLVSQASLIYCKLQYL